MASQALGIQVQVKTPTAGSLWTRLTAGLQRVVAKETPLARAAAWLHRAPTWEAVGAVGAAALVVFIFAGAVSRIATSLLKVAVLVAAVAAVYIFVIH